MEGFAVGHGAKLGLQEKPVKPASLIRVSGFCGAAKSPLG